MGQARFTGVGIAECNADGCVGNRGLGDAPRVAHTIVFSTHGFRHTSSSAVGSCWWLIAPTDARTPEVAG